MISVRGIMSSLLDNQAVAAVVVGVRVNFSCNVAGKHP